MHLRRRHIPLVVVFLAVPAAACQLLLSSDATQCNVDDDCKARAGEGFECRASVCQVKSAFDGSADADAGDAADGGPWGCLGNPPPRPVENKGKPLRINFRYLAYSTNDCENNQPVPGAEVRLCSVRDPACTRASALETKVSDCDGYVTLETGYQGIEAYLLATPPHPTAPDGDAGGAEAGAAAPRWPAKVVQCFTAQADKERDAGTSGARCAIQRNDAGEAEVPLPRDFLPLITPVVLSEEAEPIVSGENAGRVLSEGTLKLLVAVVGQEVSPTAGHLAVRANDCLHQNAAGITLSLSGGIGPNTQVYYTDATGFPNVTQGETSSRGETGYVNIEPGPTGISSISMTAVRAATGERLGVYTTYIRTGHMSEMRLLPLKN
jgi:hypothetical protein